MKSMAINKGPVSKAKKLGKRNEKMKKKNSKLKSSREIIEIINQNQN